MNCSEIKEINIETWRGCFSNYPIETDFKFNFKEMLCYKNGSLLGRIICKKNNSLLVETNSIFSESRILEITYKNENNIPEKTIKNH